MKSISKSKLNKINDMIFEESKITNTIIPLEFIQILSAGMHDNILFNVLYETTYNSYRYRIIDGRKCITIFHKNIAYPIGSVFFTDIDNLEPQIFEDTWLKYLMFDYERYENNKKDIASIVRQLEFYRDIGVFYMKNKGEVK